MEAMTVNYQLWLLANGDGAITLTGWAETSPAATPATPPNTEHWPAYPLCDNREQLPARLEQLGLRLAPGADLNDFDNHWDIYLEHTDPRALRAHLERQPESR